PTSAHRGAGPSGWPATTPATTARSATTLAGPAAPTSATSNATRPLGGTATSPQPSGRCPATSTVTTASSAPGLWTAIRPGSGVVGRAHASAVAGVAATAATPVRAPSWTAVSRAATTPTSLTLVAVTANEGSAEELRRSMRVGPPAGTG